MGIDLRLQGISCSYVKACIDACGCQIIQKATPMDMVDFKIREYNKLTKPCEVYEVDESKIKDMISEIQIKHATFLRKGKRKGKYVIRYDCIHASDPRSNSQIVGNRRAKSSRIVDVHST